ncbi:MAG: S41 family peptidase [Myxococcota bacterium]
MIRWLYSRASTLRVVPLLVLLNLVPQGQDSSPRIGREQAAADLRHWWAVVQAAHPRFEDAAARTHMGAAVERTLLKFAEEESHSAFHLKIASLAGRLSDSHTYLRRPDQRPAPVLVQGAELRLARDVDGVPAGTAIDRVGALSANVALAIARSAASGENDAARDANVPSLLPLLGTLSAAGRPIGFPPSDQRPALEIVWAAERIACMHVRTMAGDAAEFAAWFDRAFEELSERPLDGLLIDLRGNAGGSTAVGDALLSHISPKPFRLFAEKIWRVSEPMQRSLQGQPEFADYVRSRAASERYTLEARAPYVAHRLRVPVIVLINEHTASAAMMTAGAVQDFGLAVLVGRSPASPPNYFGEVYEFTLPHSRLVAGVSTARFTRPNGDAASRARVAPDVVVVGDGILEVGLSLLEANRKPAR